MNANHFSTEYFSAEEREEVIEDTWSALKANNYKAACIRSSYCKNVGQISCNIAPVTAGIVNSLNLGDIEAVESNQASIAECSDFRIND